MYTKAKLWKGENLTGFWVFTRKLDGIRMLRDPEGNPISRAGKPLYNLDHIPQEITDAEIFLKDWETSMSMCRSSVNGEPVPLDCVYSLSPLDPRLLVMTVEEPSVPYIEEMLDLYTGQGDEGLILRQEDKWLKVKPKDTYDVEVLGIQEGTGRNQGRLGALITSKGKVGTGFSDRQRDQGVPIGSIIEVEAMGLTPNGKFRHPRFIRVREDK